jgi:hypothetical protein
MPILAQKYPTPFPKIPHFIPRVVSEVCILSHNARGKNSLIYFIYIYAGRGLV